MKPAPPASTWRAIRTAVRQALTQHWGLKIIALIAAILFFSLVHGAEDEVRFVWVGVEVVPPDTSSGQMLVSNVPDRVRLTLRLRRSQLEAIKTLPSIVIDLREPGAEYYDFQADAFELPTGVRLEEIVPASIDLRWTKRAERVLPITIRTEGTPIDGYSLAGPPTPEPEEVVIAGPENVVTRLTEAYTEPVSLGLLEPGANVLQMRLAPFPTHCTVLSETTIRVTADLRRNYTERVFRRIAVTALGGTPKKLRPTRVNIRLNGPAEVLNALDNESLVPTIAMQDLSGEGAVSAKVALHSLPNETQLVAIEPESIVVER